MVLHLAAYDGQSAIPFRSDVGEYPLSLRQHAELNEHGTRTPIASLVTSHCDIQLPPSMPNHHGKLDGVRPAVELRTSDWSAHHHAAIHRPVRATTTLSAPRTPQRDARGAFSSVFFLRRGCRRLVFFDPKHCTPSTIGGLSSTHTYLSGMSDNAMQ
jgi:hypothetical protein